MSSADVSISSQLARLRDQVVEKDDAALVGGVDVEPCRQHVGVATSPHSGVGVHVPPVHGVVRKLEARVDIVGERHLGGQL
jgi:hypothetical protein